MPGIHKRGWGWFKKQKPLPDIVQESKEDIGASIAGLENGIERLRREEAKLLVNLKAAAQHGDEVSMRLLAKSLVGLRARMNKLQANVARLQSISATLEVVNSTRQMSDILQRTTANHTEDTIQRHTNPEEINATTEQFAESVRKVELIGEVIDRTLDDALDDGGMEESTAALVNQVLDSINMDLATELGTAPRNPASLPAAAAAVAGPSTPAPSDVDEVIARMQQLRTIV